MGICRQSLTKLSNVGTPSSLRINGYSTKPHQSGHDDFSHPQLYRSSTLLSLDLPLHSPALLSCILLCKPFLFLLPFHEKFFFLLTTIAVFPELTASKMSFAEMASFLSLSLFVSIDAGRL